MKKIYCFDFDGTLTYKDTMFLYLKFYNSKKYYVQLAKHIPLFVLLKLKLADAEKVKKSFIGSILKGETKDRIEEKSQRFFDHYYPQIIRQNAIDFIQNINREKTESFLITASLDIWTKPFAEKFQMNLVSTKSEFLNDRFTGNFVGRNCNGKEKVRRLNSALEGHQFDKTIAFGDTSGDQPMLDWANESHFRFFH